MIAEMELILNLNSSDCKFETREISTSRKRFKMHVEDARAEKIAKSPHEGSFDRSVACAERRKMCFVRNPFRNVVIHMFICNSAPLLAGTSTVTSAPNTHDLKL